jgi:enamine deaminase RidA (YjgF/YER057c/UK114 family)
VERQRSCRLAVRSDGRSPSRPRRRSRARLGTAPIWPDGSCDADAGVQAARCLEIILAALAEAGAGPEHVVRTRSYLVDRADEAAVSRAHGHVFRDVRPASTMIVVAGLLDHRWKVEMEAEAILDPSDCR